MQWVYLALTLLAAVFALIANALPLYHEYREQKKRREKSIEKRRPD